MAGDEKKAGSDEPNAPAKASPVEAANKAAIKSSAERIEAQEKSAAAAVVSDGPVVAGAQAFLEAAQKMAENPKYNDEGQEIGVDGVSPVSNENPSAAAVRS